MCVFVIGSAMWPIANNVLDVFEFVHYRINHFKEFVHKNNILDDLKYILHYHFKFARS